MMKCRAAGYSDDSDYSESDDEGYVYSGSSRTQRQRCVVNPTAVETIDDKLIRAVTQGDIPGIRKFLEDLPGFHIDNPLRGGYNLLMQACQEALPDVVQFLIDEGACASCMIDSFSPLLVACRSVNDPNRVSQVVRILLESNAVVNISSIYGDTPLIHACENGYTEVVRMIVNKAALDAINNTTGNSAIFYACEKNRLEIVKMLLENGASTTMRNKRGYLAKQVAEIHGFEDVVQLFPKDDLQEEEYRIPISYLSMSHYLDLAPGILRRPDVPAYFHRISSMLTGMQVAFLTPLFAENKISLPEFLKMTDNQLLNLGIEMPFLRKKILLGLFRFHSFRWKKKSVSRLKDSEDRVDTFHIYSMIAGHLQHLVVLHYSIHFLLNQGRDQKWGKPEIRDIKYVQESIRKIVCSLEVLTTNLSRIKAENPEFMVDEISEEKMNLKNGSFKNKLVGISTAGAIGISLGVFIFYKFLKRS